MRQSIRRNLSILVVILLLDPSLVEAQDPATIGAVANALSKYLMQSAEDDRWDQIGSRLTDIGRRLAVIEQQLRDISDGLFQLQRIVQEQPQVDSRNRVLSDIGVIEDNFRDWLRGPRQARAAGPILLELQKDTNDLMLRSSWSNFQVVAFGMIAERDLLVLTGQAKSTRHARFERYRRYFADAQDITKVGSIGQRWKSFHDEASTVRDRYLTPPPGATCFVGKLWTSKDNRRTCKYHLHQGLIGSIRDGWCYGDHILSNEHACYSEPRDTRGDRPDRPDRGFVGLNMVAAFRLVDAHLQDDEPAPFDTSGFLSGPVAGPQPLPGCRERGHVREFAPPGEVIDGVPNIWCPEVLNAKREKFIQDAKAADALFVALQAANRFEKYAESLRDKYRES